MNLVDVYERVCYVEPINERVFFNYFTDTIRELLTLFDGFVIEEGEEFIPPETLSDETFVRELYQNAIVDNILFIMGKGDALKNEFLRESKFAWIKYWNDDAKGRRIRRMRW